MFAFSEIKALFDISAPRGFSQEELADIQKSYGEIPAALWDYYVELGAHEALNHTQDYLIAPRDLDDYQTLDYFVFYCENQNVCAWAIKKSDIALDNPPVYENYDGDEWFQTADTVTEFMTSMAYLQAVYSFEYSNEEQVPITSAEADSIAENFLSKNADSNLYTGVKFYGDYDDTVIAVMRNDDDNFILMFGARSEDHFQATAEKMALLL